jgi:hypothetical protein
MFDPNKYSSSQQQGLWMTRPSFSKFLLSLVLLVVGIGATTLAARAQSTPSIAVGVVEGDTDGAFAAALAAALESHLAPGGAQAACPVKHMPAGAAAVIGGQVGMIDGAMHADVALSTQPDGVVLASLPDVGPAAGFAELAEAVVSDLLRLLCAGGAELTPTVIYEASGGGPQITITGKVEALDKEFTLEGAFPGGKAIFTYAPVSPGGGAVSYELSGSGVTGSGEGLYTTSLQADGTVVIEQTSEGCVDGIANSCRTNSETILLTPVAP